MPCGKRCIADDVNDLEAYESATVAILEHSGHCAKDLNDMFVQLTAPKMIGGSLFPSKNESDAQA